MAASNQRLAQFLTTWEVEAQRTLRLLEALPVDQYDYRPDVTGRSLGELAWHLAELENYMTWGIETGAFGYEMKPPAFERPREVAGLAPGYRQIHVEALARVHKLKPTDFDRRMKFFGAERTVGEILWHAVLNHGIHHRGQLTLLCRLAGGRVPSLYGPTREDIAALKAAAQART